MNVVLVVGNPKRGSRTRRAGELLAYQLTAAPPSDVIEVIDLGPALFTWGDQLVNAAKDKVRAAELLIVASPTYKATYTGLVKLFLDQFGAGELIGVVAIPLMLGAALNHALAPELLLKPVLVEIGCTCPTPGLYLLESNYEQSAELDAWLVRARAAIPELSAR